MKIKLYLHSSDARWVTYLLYDAALGVVCYRDRYFTLGYKIKGELAFTYFEVTLTTLVDREVEKIKPLKEAANENGKNTNEK